MIRFEFFKPDQHYNAICEWWYAEDFAPIPLNHLPENGIVIYSGDKMACAAWIYRTDSAFCILDWYIANPEIRKKERSDCLDLLISVSKEYIKKLGHLTIFTMSKHSALVSRLEKHGFLVSANNMTSLTLNFHSGGN